MATAASIWSNSLAGAASNTDVTQLDTSNVTPTNGRILIAWVASTLASTPNTPTIVATSLGSSLTWTQIDTVTVGSNLTLTAFWALVSGSPSGQFVRFDFAGQTQLATAYRLVEFANVDNASPIITANTTHNSNTSGTTLTVTLPNALTAAMNRTLGIFASGNNGTWTVNVAFQSIGGPTLSTSDGVTTFMEMGVALAIPCVNNGSAVSKVAIGMELSQDGSGMSGGSVAVNPLQGFVR